MTLLFLLACASRTLEVPPAAVPAPAPAPVGGFYCFSWIHGEDFSTDCYETLEVCEARRAEMGRESTRCEAAKHASCTTLARNGESRCFGDMHNCERYRAYVAGNGLESGACAER